MKLNNYRIYYNYKLDRYYPQRKILSLFYICFFDGISRIWVKDYDYAENYIKNFIKDKEDNKFHRNCLKQKRIEDKKKKKIYYLDI